MRKTLAPEQKRVNAAVRILRTAEKKVRQAQRSAAYWARPTATRTRRWYWRH